MTQLGVLTPGSKYPQGSQGPAAAGNPLKAGHLYVETAKGIAMRDDRTILAVGEQLEHDSSSARVAAAQVLDLGSRSGARKETTGKERS